MAAKKRYPSPAQILMNIRLERGPLRESQLRHFEVLTLQALERRGEAKRVSDPLGGALWQRTI